MTLQETSSDSQALADSLLLEKIDKLFACNVGQYIGLPQIVVVGDQSSGKSSVLEGLTRLSFPRDSGLCTRFATQIVFRRDLILTQRQISVSIIPASDTDAAAKEELARWSSSGIATLSDEGFSQMMTEVHQIMGLSVSNGDGLPTFSNHVLQLEIRGPQENHLSVIDVPGIFSAHKPGLTTKEDIVLVREMVLRYMKNERSIMLTVVPANVDDATQVIIEMARELDPEGERTLQVLTKPDLVDEGAKDKVVEMVENATNGLGWIVLRNLGQAQLSHADIDRDRQEEVFYQTSPWNRLRVENFGVKALRSRLREVLTASVRRAFPSVRAEVIKKLNQAKADLKSLGKERETPEQQRGFLLDIISDFQELTQLALTTNYGARDVFEKKESLRLATSVINRNITFADEILTKGHRFSFQTNYKDDNRTESPTISDEEDGSDRDRYSSNEEQCVLSRNTDSCEDLQEILHENVEIQLPSAKGVLDWIQAQHHQSRGFEVGTFSSSLIATLMKKQSMKWSALSMGYISDIIVIVHRFIQENLRTACDDSRLCSSIISLLMDSLMDKYRQALSKAEFLLRIELEGTPMTMNHYLNDNMQICRQKRMRSAMSKHVIEYSNHGKCVRLSDIIQQTPMNNTDHTVKDLHDILHAYYKVALKRFIDNICMQAADYHLVTGPEAPMKLFSPAWVSSLPEDKLEEIAGEEKSTRRRRRQLRKQIEELEAGRKGLI
ncbi:Dynamin [Penicillium hordei]|uniref:Dynamin n=1 Tax=Penicillium hordei TaxID=40994 RepID=A0AAD6H3B2_9EURO|nr:Dynamin [Penicillium hordei]KAJ5607274.1 Dynamin [Penicillium hordei]